MRLLDFRFLPALLLLLISLPETSLADYVKLKSSIKEFGENVPAGTNVWIEYQDSDFWYLSRSTLFTTPIPKEISSLVPRISFDPPMHGQNRCSKNLYALEPAEYVSFNIGHTTIKSGLGTLSRIKIYYKEDNLYAVSFDNENEPTGRTEVSCIAVTASDTKEHEDAVPSLPWTNNQWLYYVVAPCVALLLLAANLLRIRRQSINNRPENKAARAKESALKEKLGKERRDVADMIPLINKRFPSPPIFHVPDRVSNILRDRGGQRRPQIDEDYPDRWKSMLDRYPDPPRNERERLEREDAFWTRYARLFLDAEVGKRPELKPKQYIVDYFEQWEKWIFRDYYAATGIVHETIVKTMCQLVLDVENAHSLKTFGGNTSLSNNQKRADIEKAEEAEKRFARQEMPQHMKEWGGWFFINIQDAFKKQYEPNPGHGPTSPVSPPGQNTRDPTKWIPNA